MNNNSAEVVVNDILSLADHLFRTLLPTVPDELLSLDATMPQLKILLLLYIHGPLRMSAIANELRVTLPTSTSLIDKLVDKNYILRENQTDDRRVVLCKLTSEGQKVVGNIWVSTRARCQQILLNMDYAKLELFREALNSMLKSADSPQMKEIMKNQSFDSV
jgi:DNA-binding MarR family transcriptional regulator